MKALFVINPVAGKGRGLAFIKAFESIIKEHISYEIVVTQAKGEATKIVRDYTAKEDYIVYAVGGDGTINEVANGLVGTKSQLAIIPTGSGNDFVRSIYPKLSNEELLMALLKGKSEKIDLIKADEKYFLNIASVGLDADVVYNATAYKKHPFIKGDMAYILSLFKTIFGPKGTMIRVSIDGKEVCNEKILLLAIANGRFYGGGVLIAPHAKLSDSIANVCLVRECRLLKLLPIVPKLFKATHEEAKEVEVHRAKEIKIEAVDGCRLNIDGEITKTNKVKMEIISNALNIIVPTV